MIAYLKYLKKEASINDVYNLDFTQIKTLNSIAFFCLDKREVKVGDILSLSNIASRATIHAALKKLKSNNLIQFRTVSDTRAKYVELTELGIKRFNELASAMSK